MDFQIGLLCGSILVAIFYETIRMPLHPNMGKRVNTELRNIKVISMSVKEDLHAIELILDTLSKNGYKDRDIDKAITKILETGK